ncbi:MAG: GTP-binding protein [Candidatus Adiutrix sp.]|jgi:G3E family GTPase|nr:GTP-binding protein [Candidatus Adiutrix sp.]
MKTDIFMTAGFLGSGKTSTLRHVLENLPDAAGAVALVNEAGALGLDGRLLERAGIPVHELRNGCICCSLQVDFISLLNDLFQSSPPARILMEASGLADPAKMIQTLSRFDRFLGLRKTIVLLDAEIWETREAQGDFFHAQLNSADLILLSKTDLYRPDQAKKFALEIEALFPGIPLYPVIRGRVDPQVFLAPPGKFKTVDEAPDNAALGAYQSFSFESPRAVESEKWLDFIQAEGGRYERVKGQVLLTTGPAYFDYVRGRYDWKPPLESVSGAQLVFVGRDLDHDALRAKLGRLFGDIQMFPFEPPGPQAPEQAE